MKETELIEALLFVSSNPVTKKQLQEVLKDIPPDYMEKFINEINEEYIKTNRSFRIEEIAGGWQIRTKPEFSPWIKSLLNVQRKERLSGPALETLAIVAYKQPITKAEIEGIRGVNVDWVLSSLVDKGLVRIVGRKDVVGHPFMYGTTTSFLEHFGLAGIKDLPNIEELRNSAVTGAAKVSDPVATGGFTAANAPGTPEDTTSAVLASPDVTSGLASVDPKDRTLTKEPQENSGTVEIVAEEDEKIKADTRIEPPVVDLSGNGGAM